jgi:hypothetical protein
MKIKFGYSSLTHHAQCRLYQRTNITDVALRKILDRNAYISLGMEIVFDREHCLFYSQADNECFVAVQDSKTGEVITVLPIEYHKTLSWKIDKKLYYEIDEELLRRSEVLAKYNVDPDSMAIQMSLKIRYLNSKDAISTKTLKKFPAELYQNNPHILVNNKQKILNIVTRWKKGKDVQKVIDIYVSLGRKSKPYFVCEEVINELNSTNVGKKIVGILH